MITLLTLNLWGYTDWDNRLGNITDFIDEIDADVVVFQEAQQDNSFSNKSQAEIIANHSNYKFRVFTPTSKKPSLSANDIMAEHGLAVISKYEITSVRLMLLNKQSPEHEQCGALYVRIKINARHIDVCNVHFHNTDSTSLLHLNEVLNFFKKRRIQPVMLGDFNIYELSKCKGLLASYNLSTDYKKYVSFEKDGGTLDYIVTPSEQYSIISVGTSESYVSDHKAVWARIKQR